MRPRTKTRLLSRVPGLKRLPLFKLLAIGEIALLGWRHASRLTPEERMRLLHLVRTGRGRRRNLAPDEREELAALIAKAEPRRFMGAAADRLSPVPLPRRIVDGPRRR